MIRFILLRGLGREQQHWGELPSLLLQHFPGAQIDTPDLAGSGKLNNISSPLTINDYIPYLTEQIPPLNSVNISHQTVLIGLSLGGMIGLHWFSQHREKFSHLVLINTSSQLNAFYKRLRLGNVLSEVPNLASKSIEEGELARYHLTCNKTPIDNAVIKQWVDIQTQHPVKLTNLAKQLCAASLFTPPLLPGSHNKSKSFASNSELGKGVTLFASRHDNLVNVNCSETLAQHYQVPIIYHPWAGHDIPQDDPIWICHQLSDILKVAYSETSSAHKAISLKLVQLETE